MILSDVDVKEYIKNGKIIIEPFEPEKYIMPVGVDLRLGNTFKGFKITQDTHIDPTNVDLELNTELIEVQDGKSFIVHPGEFILGVTKEHIELPNDIAGRIDGRSSLGRLGIIVHSTAGHVDPGWKGKLTLEISNIGKLPVALTPGMKFCSLIFEKLSSPSEHGYRGKYAGYDVPATSKIAEEFKK